MPEHNLNTLNTLINKISDKSPKTRKHSTSGNVKISRDNLNRILDILKNYIKLDKTFRLKHESLKTLYNAYLDIYNKSGQSVQSEQGNSSQPDSNQEMLKKIHTEMRDNNTHLYNQRLIILKQIKDNPDIDHHLKNKICGRLIAIFKNPPIPDYKPMKMLMIHNQRENPRINDILGDGVLGNGSIESVNHEKIKVSELDKAYLQKHNELMTVYKAYQNLYNKVLNYKDQLDEYKKLPTGSSISRDQMDKLINDQAFVMEMIDKMQDNLVSNKIIDEAEKVPVAPVINHPGNIESFNNTMRDQIKHIIDRRIDLNNGTKNKITNLLKQYQGCPDNDQFCNSGKRLIVLKKMDK